MASSRQKREDGGVPTAARGNINRKRYFSDAHGLQGSNKEGSKRQRSEYSSSGVPATSRGAHGSGTTSSNATTAVVSSAASGTDSSSVAKANRRSSSVFQRSPNADSRRTHVQVASGRKGEDASWSNTKGRKSAANSSLRRRSNSQRPHKQQRQEQELPQEQPEKVGGGRQHNRQHVREKEKRQHDELQREQKLGGKEGHLPERQRRDTQAEHERKQRRSAEGGIEKSPESFAAAHPQKQRRKGSAEASVLGGGAASDAALATSSAAGAAFTADPEGCRPRKKKQFSGVRTPRHVEEVSGMVKPENEKTALKERPSLDSCVFVRQVPETAEEEEMKKLFSQFGDVVYVKFVLNAQGERQGSAFVQFKKSAVGQESRLLLLLQHCAAVSRGCDHVFAAKEIQEAAARAIRAASTTPSAPAGSAASSQIGRSSSSGAAAAEHKRPAGLSAFAAEALGYSAYSEQQHASADQRAAAAAPLGGEGVFLRGSRLLVHAALSKEESQKLRQQHSQSKRLDRETRHNRHLAFVGMMSPGSDAFQKLPPAEQRRRLQAWQEKKAKLKNPNYFINPKRLSLRNLPTAVTVNQIRKVITHFLMNSPEFAACVDCGEVFTKSAGAPATTKENKEPHQFRSLPSWRQRRIAEKAVPKIHISRDKSRKTAAAAQSLPGLQQQSSKRSRGFAFAHCCHEKVAELLLPFLGSCTSSDFSEERLQLLGAGTCASVPELPEGGEKGVEQREDGEGDERETSLRRGSLRARPSWRQLMVEYALEDLRKVKIKEEKKRAYMQLLERQREQQQSPGGVGTTGSKATAAAALHHLSRAKKKKIYSRGKRQRERRRQARLAALGEAASNFASPVVPAVAAGVTASAAAATSACLSRKEQKGRKRTAERYRESGAKLDTLSRIKEAVTSGSSNGDTFENSFQEYCRRDGAGGGGEKLKSLDTLQGHVKSRRYRQKLTTIRDERQDLEEEALRSRVCSLLRHNAWMN